MALSEEDEQKLSKLLNELEEVKEAIEFIIEKNTTTLSGKKAVKLNEVDTRIYKALQEKQNELEKEFNDIHKQD